MTAQLTTLSNGLRIISNHVPGMHSTAIGIWCDVGTRYESADQNGIAHLVEHMLFKGTPSRDAYKIAETIENVGGQMNAYTSREFTAYYIHLLKEDTFLGLDILADMVLNHTFPEEELEKEREVILQEIGMTHDTPDDLIFDVFQETAYPGQAIGAPILGSPKTVKSMQQSVLFDYTKQFYAPERLVISAAGSIDHDKLVKKCEELFSTHTSSFIKNAAPQARYEGGIYRGHRTELEQVHIVLGFQGIPRISENYQTAQLLSIITGGGMSSRLFQEIREKRGLVYSIYSSNSGYRDDGMFEVYAGTGEQSVKELIPVVCEELNKLRSERVDDKELARAKAQLKANILMGGESMLSRANRQATYLMNFGKAENMERTLESIDAVTSDNIRDMASRFFSSTPTLAALGPLDQLEDYETLKTRLRA